MGAELQLSGISHASHDPLVKNVRKLFHYNQFVDYVQKNKRSFVIYTRLNVVCFPKLLWKDLRVSFSLFQQ